MESRTGILLLNLGTPEDCSVQAVRRYLAEFLMDPCVVDVPFLLRFFLVYGLILPFRPRRSAEAYQSIWLTEGSPLLIYSTQLARALQAALLDKYCVELGMRYGQPSIASAIDALFQSAIDEIVVVPLFPQYSRAATGSALDAAINYLNKRVPVDVSVRVVDDFHASSFYIDSLASLIESESKQNEYDYLLLSYHGLPERQLQQQQCCDSVCDRKMPCPLINTANAMCYRAQCYETSRAVGQKLSLSLSDYSVSFQSRLGRTPWIGPYTDEIIGDLYKQGVRRLAVACPSFVCDCLETLEEIGIQLRQQWLAMGGTELHLIPCLNAEPQWVRALAGWIEQLD